MGESAEVVDIMEDYLIIKPETEERKPGGISFKLLCVIMLILSVVFAVITSMCTRVLRQEYEQLNQAMTDYGSATTQITNLQNSSRELTQMVQLFLVTGDSEYAVKYANLFENTSMREGAVAALSTIMADNRESIDALKKALEESNQLADTELHAMKLMTLAVESDSNIPDIITGYSLPEDEIVNDREEYNKMAFDMIFSKEYTLQSSGIMERVFEATENVKKYLSDKCEEYDEKMYSVLFYQRLMLIMSLVLIAAIFVEVLIFILHPLVVYQKNISADSKIDLNGASELQALGIAYNSVFDSRLQKKQALIDQAENDAVTGVYNRNGFDRITHMLSNTDSEFALLIIDLDYFKGVNDNHGHEIGDRALRKVARYLQYYFSNKDYIVRYGGDEFVLFMMNATKNHRQTILEKINKINMRLQAPRAGEEIPAMSVSVGVAFTSEGYSEKLFNNADKALYVTKANGRCGLHFYDESEE